MECVQQCFNVIRVTFSEEQYALAALQNHGVHLDGMWCRLDGGPPTTILHVFDFPFEESEDVLRDFFSHFGIVKGVRHQRYLKKDDIKTGTRLIDIVLRDTPPRLSSINGSMCKIWYRGQPVICNICATQGHKSAVCPQRNKCRLCEQEGHIARNCPNPWGTATVGAPAADPALPDPVAPTLLEPGTPPLAPASNDDIDDVPSQAQGSLSPASTSAESFITVPDLAVSQLPEQPDEEFVDASDGSDIDEFSDTGSESSLNIADFPSTNGASDVEIVKVVTASDSGPLSQLPNVSQQSQSILPRVQQDVNSAAPEASSLSEPTQHSSSSHENGSVNNVEISKTVPVSSDVDSMDPSLVSLKRQTRAPTGESRKKQKGFVSDHSAKGCPVGLPALPKDRPSKN